MEQQLENVTATKSDEQQHLNLQEQVQQSYPTKIRWQTLLKDKSDSK